jgi:hypothetical protein
MTLACKRCKGRVFIDRVFSAEEHLELYCGACGKRWIFHDSGTHNVFVKWLMRKEKEYLRLVQG